MIRSSTLSLAITMAFFYGLTALASALEWPHAAAVVIAWTSFALLLGSRVVLMGPVARRRVRATWGRRRRALWRRVRRAARRTHT